MVLRGLHKRRVAVAVEDHVHDVVLRGLHKRRVAVAVEDHVHDVVLRGLHKRRIAVAVEDHVHNIARVADEQHEQQQARDQDVRHPAAHGGLAAAEAHVDAEAHKRQKQHEIRVEEPRGKDKDEGRAAHELVDGREQRDRGAAVAPARAGTRRASILGAADIRRRSTRGEQQVAVAVTVTVAVAADRAEAFAKIHSIGVPFVAPNVRVVCHACETTGPGPGTLYINKIRGA